MNIIVMSSKDNESITNVADLVKHYKKFLYLDRNQDGIGPPVYWINRNNKLCNLRCEIWLGVEGLHKIISQRTNQDYTYDRSWLNILPYPILFQCSQRRSFVLNANGMDIAGYERECDSVEAAGYPKPQVLTSAAPKADIRLSPATMFLIVGTKEAGKENKYPLRHAYVVAYDQDPVDGRGTIYIHDPMPKKLFDYNNKRGPKEMTIVKLLKESLHCKRVKMHFGKKFNGSNCFVESLQFLEQVALSPASYHEYLCESISYD